MSAKTKAKHTPPCNSAFGCVKSCKGKTVLNRVGFVCTEGQNTYEHHVDDFSVYAAAPELLAALKAVEWAGIRNECPNCTGTQGIGYRPSCALSLAIARAEGKE